MYEGLHDKAFPVMTNAGFAVGGLTKREYFAVHIMTGILASCAAPDVKLPSPGDAAEIAVGYANRLIAHMEANPCPPDRP